MARLDFFRSDREGLPVRLADFQNSRVRLLRDYDLETLELLLAVKIVKPYKEDEMMEYIRVQNGVIVADQKAFLRRG